MTRITAQMREVAEKAGAFAVATATTSGEPNVVPMTFARVLPDDRILLMDNFLSKTMENIRANPRVAVSIWQQGPSEGYQFKGEARIETAGQVFEDGLKWVRNKSPKLNPRAAVVVEVDSIYLLTPGLEAGNRVS